MKIKTKKSAGTPFGIIILMLYEFIVTIFLISYFIFLIPVVLLGGSVFGISDPMILKILLLIAAIGNATALIGLFKRLDLGRWIVISFSSIMILFEIAQMVIISFKNSFKYLMDFYFDMNDVFIILTCFFIILYLSSNKNVKRYFDID